MMERGGWRKLAPRSGASFFCGYGYEPAQKCLVTFVYAVERANGYAGFSLPGSRMGIDLFVQPHFVVLTSGSSAQSGGYDSPFD